MKNLTIHNTCRALFSLALPAALVLSGAACDSQGAVEGPTRSGSPSVGSDPVAEPTDMAGPSTRAPTVVGTNAPTQPTMAPVAPVAPKPLEVVREFTCDPAAIPGDTAVSDVQNLPGATVDIRPLADEDEQCSYHLVFRDVDGAMTQLSPPDDPGGYLLAIAGQSPAGHVMTCASDIDHDLDPEGASATRGEQPRRINDVGIDCAVRSGDAWTPLSRVIEPDGDWAAWVVGLEAANDGSPTFRVLWIRDFSFQFLNLSDAGRTVGDGIYATLVSVDAEGEIEVGPTELVSERIVPEEAHEHGGWDPTDAELQELDGYVVKDDGDCPPPYGCK